MILRALSQVSTCWLCLELTAHGVLIVVKSNCHCRTRRSKLPTCLSLSFFVQSPLDAGLSPLYLLMVLGLHRLTDTAFKSNLKSLSPMVGWAEYEAMQTSSTIFRSFSSSSPTSSRSPAIFLQSLTICFSSKINHAKGRMTITVSRSLYDES